MRCGIDVALVGRADDNPEKALGHLRICLDEVETTP